MATTITDENFGQYWDSAMTSYGFNAHFVDAMEQYGKAMEPDAQGNNDITPIDAEDLEDGYSGYTLPLVSASGGVYSYAQVTIADFIEAVADKAAEIAVEDDLLEAISQEEFDEIFGSSSSSD